MNKVSIIIPVCNVKNYISPCIDSVLSQTLMDIEIICVDDGSHDGSELILDNYAERDKRIKVIHKANAGYGAAINTGIQSATGEYIGIVESDDMVLPNMYEELYIHAKKDNLDIVKSDAYFWLEKYDYKHRIHIKALDHYYDKVLTDKDREVFYKFYMNTWTGIYKKSFLLDNNIWHNETPGASYQDNGFWIQTLGLCERAMWLNQAFYFYRQDNPLASIKSKSKVYAMKNEYQHTEAILREKNCRKVADICNYYRAVRNKGNFIRISDDLKREFCDTIIEDYNSFRELISKDSLLNAWYEEVVRNPDQYCSKFIDNKKALLQQLEDSKKLVIYGIGAYGQKAFRNIVNLGFYDKLAYFVTSKESNVGQIGKVKVACFENVKNDIKDALFIVAVSPSSAGHDEIINNLKNSHINSYVEGIDLNTHFYLV